MLIAEVSSISIYPNISIYYIGIIIYIYVHIYIYILYIYIYQLVENFGSWKMAWPNEKGPSDFACVIGDEKRACHAMWTKPPAKSGYGVSASMLTLGDINPLVLVNMIQHRVETRSQPCEPQNSSQMDILVQEVLIHSHRSGSQLAGSPFFFVGESLRRRSGTSGGSKQWYLKEAASCQLGIWWCNVPILKNDGVRLWEGWHPIYEMENKKCLKATSYLSLGLPVVTINGP
jgi:hypothetical protein